jgi:hypothetical protein
VAIVVLNKFLDPPDQFTNTAKATPTDCLLGGKTEPALDLVEPRGICRCVVDLEARPLGQPGTYFAMFVGGVVVDDQMHLQMGGNGTVDALQKSQKFLVAVPGLAFGEHRSSSDIKCRE